MMLTISGLPSSTKYADLKGLIRQECGISEFILDKLSPDSNGMKKVQVGVMDDGQGNCLIKCLDGYRILGHVLSVTPLGQMQQESQHAPNNNFDRGNGNYTQKNYQGNQSQQGNYDSLDTHRPEPWNSGGHGNQWEPQSHQNMNAHNNMGYQQQVPMNNYGQQQGQQSHQGHQPSREMHYQNDYPPPASQPNTHHSGYVGGYNAQNNVNKAVPPAKASQRPHVLRSVEILQEPARYDHPHTHVGSIQQQKPITIMKENFQGAQFGAHYQQPGPSWQPPVQQEKPAFKPASYDRSFTEPNNIELAPHDNYNAPMPRFSPRDEVPKNLGPKFSPRRDIPKPGPRFSPRRDINKDASRFSPRRDVPKDGPRFSPRRELGKSGPGPRFSPRRDVPRFSPRRDVPKDGPGPRFSPRRDIPKDGPRFSPRRDVPKPGPRFSPRRDISKSGPGPRFSPGRDIIKPGPGPRFSPRRDIGNDGPRFSPRRDIPKEGPRFSPRRDLKDRVGPRFSPHRDIPRFSPRRDLPKDVPRFSPRRDIPKDAPRFSPRRELHKEGPRFSPRRDLAKDGPRFSPRMDIPKDHVPRFSPRRDAPRFSPRRDVSKAGPGPRFSPRRDISGPIRVSPGRRMSPGRRISPGDRRAGPRRSPHRDSPPRTGRYSPTRHMDKPPEKYVAKDVRPAYEPNSAPSQAMYTDVYRAIVTDNVQYPIPALRQPEVPVWQQIRDKSGERRSKFEANIPTGVEDKRLPERKSRSPLRSDRFKRHSPSPRSPRRSWALEKRRSPDIRDAPPPPIWPGASNDDYRPKEKTPTWERPAFDDKLRRPEERNNPNRVRPDLKGPLDPPTRRFEDRFPREQSPVRQDMGRKNYHERKFEKDIPERREERFPTAKPLTKVQEQFEKEIEDVYKRAVEFTKRTEVLRKGDRRREEHSDGRRETERVYERPYSREESRREDDFRDDRRHEDSYKRNEERSQDFGRHETKYLEKKRSDPQEYRGKKEKAEDDLADKLMKKYGDYLSIDMKRRVLVELKIAISKMLRDMFGNDDVSYIEMIIKFTAKYEKDEKKIFNDVLSNFPSNYRKRPAEETLKTDHPSAKVPKRTPETNVNQGALPVPVIPAVEQQTSRFKTPASKRPIFKKTPVEIRPLKRDRPRDSIVSESPASKSPLKTAVKKPPAVESRSILKKDRPKESTEVPSLPSPSQHELDSLMSKLLDSELKDIMAKFWQALHNAPSEADKVVVGKIKNEIGDDFKNVLGLNVTKRLLNVHNQLFAKAHFSRQPHPKYLKAFVTNFNCTGVKRIATRDENDYTLAIQFSSIEDFDKLCNNKYVRCGDAKVTITPCYKFTHCPVTIKTIYNEHTTKDIAKSSIVANENEKGVKSTIEQKQTDAKKEQLAVAIEKASIIDGNESKAAVENTPKVVPKKKVVVPKATTATTVKTTVEVTKEPNKIEANSDTLKAKTSPVKQTEVNEVKAETKTNPAVVKVTSTKVATPKIVPEDKDNILKADTKNNTPVSKVTLSEVVGAKVAQEANKTAASKVQVNAKVSSVKTAEVKMTISKAITVKPPENNVATNTKTTPLKAVETKGPAKTPAKTTEVKPSLQVKKTPETLDKNVDQVKTAPETTIKKVLQVKKTPETAVKKVGQVKTIAVPAAKSVKTKSEAKVKPLDDKMIDDFENSDEMCAEDDDILNDEDILALMQQAIVLDECAGSDDE